MCASGSYVEIVSCVPGGLYASVANASLQKLSEGYIVADNILSLGWKRRDPPFFR